MTNPMIRRVAAVDATIARFNGKPLQYGKDDCARMASFCLRKLGIKTPILKAGTYSTAVGAARAMKRMGVKDLIEGVDLLGLPRIAPASALPGDILALPGENDHPALAVAVGNGRVLGWWNSETGICAVVQPLQYLAAWRSL